MDEITGETTIEQKPWHVEFQWQNMKSRITLENG